MAGITCLTHRDPDPVALERIKSKCGILVVCDHAGDEIPEVLRRFDLSGVDLSDHIAVDVGARAVARVLARELNATLVHQVYSRLVVDMNRPCNSDEIMPATSDGTVIPFNQEVSELEREARLNLIYRPYHDRITSVLNSIGSEAVLVAVHSFTPQLRNAEPRPWHVDLMSRTHSAFVDNLERHLREEDPSLNIGQSQIFQMSDNRDFTIPFHAEPRGIPNVSIEIRNDLLRTESNTNRWGKMLARCIPASLQTGSNVLIGQASSQVDAV